MTTTTNLEATPNQIRGTFIDVGHDLDDRTVPDITRRLDSAWSDDDPGVVVLNFHDTHAVDPSGLAFLRSIATTAARHNIRIVLTEVRPALRRQLTEADVAPLSSGTDGESILLSVGLG